MIIMTESTYDNVDILGIIHTHYGKALDEEAMWRKAVYYLEADTVRSCRYRRGGKPQKHDECV